MSGGYASIYSSIRIPKVGAANAAEQFAGDRLWDPSSQVCPTRPAMSSSGVMDVAYDTLQVYNAGCFDPNDRINVENTLRPDYSTYLNTDGYTNAGVTESATTMTSSHIPSYDTQIGITSLVRPILPRAQLLQTASHRKLALSSAGQDHDSGYEKLMANVTSRNNNGRY